MKRINIDTSHPKALSSWESIRTEKDITSERFKSFLSAWGKVHGASKLAYLLQKYIPKNSEEYRKYGYNWKVIPKHSYSKVILEAWDMHHRFWSTQHTEITKMEDPKEKRETPVLATYKDNKKFEEYVEKYSEELTDDLPNRIWIKGYSSSRVAKEVNPKLKGHHVRNFCQKQLGFKIFDCEETASGANGGTVAATLQMSKLNEALRDVQTRLTEIEHDTSISDIHKRLKDIESAIEDLKMFKRELQGD